MNELLLFAKAPRPGFVKTRLAEGLGKEALGKEEACRAYIGLLQVIARSLASLKDVTVCYSPEGAEKELRPFFSAQWGFRRQQGTDLGTRLYHAISTCLGNGAAKVVVIGADCPYVTTDDIESAWRALDQSDVVFGPAQDGGYWLVGMTRPHAALFAGIPWGTSTVLRDSLARAEELRLRTTLLRTLSDIDTAADWRAYLASSKAQAHLTVNR